jgi:hypothetical protein
VFSQSEVSCRFTSSLAGVLFGLSFSKILLHLHHAWEMSLGFLWKGKGEVLAYNVMGIQKFNSP